jgi:membrane fusion protein (multidrug efflux system)
MALLPKKHLPLVAGGVIALAIVIGGGAWWLDRQKYEATDNAFVQADKVNVAPQVDGYVAEVLVTDNQHVNAGQVLVRLDLAPLKAALAQAQANAAAMDAAVRAVDDKARLEQALIQEKAAGVASARAQSQLAEAELARYGALAHEGWVSPQRAQTARATASQATAGVAQAQATLQAERRIYDSLGSARAQTLAEAQAAHAAVEQAQINLERAEIRAPVSGVVGARAVRLGQYVRPGTVMMSVVPLGEAFVIANFKETQVSRLRVGQPVAIQGRRLRQAADRRQGQFLRSGHRLGVRPDPRGERGGQLHQDRPALAGEDRRRPQFAPRRGLAPRPLGGGEGRRHHRHWPQLRRRRRPRGRIRSPRRNALGASVADAATAPPGHAAPGGHLTASGEVDWVKIFLGFGGMVIGQFMAILDIQIVASSLSQIQAGVGASADEISWVQTIYLLAEVVIIPLTAFLTKMWGTRPVYVAAAAGFIVTSILTGLSTSIETMIVMRAFQGLAAGAMIPAVFATAMTVFPPEKRVTANVIVASSSPWRRPSARPSGAISPSP